MIERIRKAAAISVDALNTALAEFHEYAAPGETLAGPAEYGPTDWIWVKRLGNRYYLNADTTAEGVGVYLKLVTEHGPKLAWSVVANERGRMNKVAFGPARTVIPGFYFYSRGRVSSGLGR